MQNYKQQLLCQLIKEEINNNQLSVKFVAQKCHYDKSTIYRILAKRRIPQIPTLIHILRSLNSNFIDDSAFVEYYDLLFNKYFFSLIIGKKNDAQDIIDKIKKSGSCLTDSILRFRYQLAIFAYSYFFFDDLKSFDPHDFNSDYLLCLANEDKKMYYLILTSYYEDIGKWNETVKYSKFGLDIPGKIAIFDTMLKYHSLKSLVMTNDLIEAFNQANKIYDELVSNDEFYLAATAKQMIARIYIRTGNLEKAKAVYIELVKYAKEKSYQQVYIDALKGLLWLGIKNDDCRAAKKAITLMETDVLPLLSENELFLIFYYAYKNDDYVIYDSWKNRRTSICISYDIYHDVIEMIVCLLEKNYAGAVKNAEAVFAQASNYGTDEQAVICEMLIDAYGQLNDYHNAETYQNHLLDIHKNNIYI